MVFTLFSNLQFFNLIINIDNFLRRRLLVSCCLSLFSHYFIIVESYFRDLTSPGHVSVLNVLTVCYFLRFTSCSILLRMSFVDNHLRSFMFTLSLTSLFLHISCSVSITFYIHLLSLVQFYFFVRTIACETVLVF